MLGGSTIIAGSAGMKRKTAFILAIAAGFPGGAAAEVIKIGPDPCPVPADAQPYVAPPDVAAEDLSPWRELSEGPPLIFDVTLGREGDERLFQRLAINPETGEIIGVRPRYADCPQSTAAP